MSEPTDQQLPPEPHDGIDAAANPEAQAYESEQTPALSRAGAGDGAPPTDAPPAGQQPEAEGTVAGDALAGVHISEQDAEDAVPGDEGPEHPGVRRST